MAAEKQQLYLNIANTLEELTLDSWYLTEPNFTNPAVFVPALKHAIQPGHFIKVVNNGATRIGRIIRTSMHIGDACMEAGHEITTLRGLAKVNWFLP
jgi:hypothetical protein